jgi:D-glycero-D-manno-heptose 1,7-bisphosphate phosphatase
MVSAVGVRLEEIYFCPHVPEDECVCRKPRLGLLMRAASELHFNPADAIVIGDKMSDMEFGRRAGATTILIAPELTNPYGAPARNFVANDLVDAARIIQRLRNSN